jgi:uncharacterized protein DUF5658
MNSREGTKKGDYRDNGVQMNTKGGVWVEQKWFLPLGLSWLFFNLFDLGITFWAIATGTAVEANPLMRPIIGIPLLAALIKLGLASSALKLAERIHTRTRFSSFPILLLMNLHIGLACVSNVLTVMNSPHAEMFRFLNPLGM